MVQNLKYFIVCGSAFNSNPQCSSNFNSPLTNWTRIESMHVGVVQIETLQHGNGTAEQPPEGSWQWEPSGGGPGTPTRVLRLVQ